MFRDPQEADDCYDRLRIGQNEAHTCSLLTDMMSGERPKSLRDQQRVAANEAENLALLAGIAARSRAAGRLAA